MKRARVIVVALIAVLLLGGATVMRIRTAGTSPVASVPNDVRAPAGVRVRVEVLNGTKTRGLARRATALLRDRGFDVVEMGTESQAQIPDTTIVYDFSRHPDWAARVARVFPPARVVARPDSSRYLDVGLVLGSAWRPPAQPFYP